MTRRHVLYSILAAFISLSGCAGSAPPDTGGTGLTPAEVARLAELTVRQETAASDPDSAMTAAEYQELTRLRDKRDEAEKPESEGNAYVVVGIVGVAVIALFVAMVVSLSNQTYNF